MIKDATFISIWDDGICVSSPCKVNTETFEVFDIGENDYLGDDGELDILQSEWVRVDEEEYLACPYEDLELNKSSYTDGKNHDVYWYA